MAQYTETAQENGLQITDVFDTHVHADQSTGSLELAARTCATIHVHPAGEVAYTHEAVHEGQHFRFGVVELEIIETPGHTPNSITTAVTDHGRSQEVFALLTGDLLFVGDVGRPDLVGQDMLEMQVRALYESLYKKLSRFPDWTEVYPAHGEGFLCGRSMSAKPMTTLGFERWNNPLLRDLPFEEFHRIMTNTFQIHPPNFAAIVDRNRRGPSLLSEMPNFSEFSVLQVESAIRQNARIVDVRDQITFGAAFIPGLINIGLIPNSVNWLGMVLDADTDIIIIADNPASARQAEHQFYRAGYDRLTGYLDDGISRWALQGKPLDHLPQLTPASLKHVLSKYHDHVVLDVRTDLEWQTGHIDQAIHIPIPKLLKNGIDLDQQRHITTVCRSGYRSNIAGSFLESLAYEHVFSLIGGMTAWNAARRTV